MARTGFIRKRLSLCRGNALCIACLMIASNIEVFRMNLPQRHRDAEPNHFLLCVSVSLWLIRFLRKYSTNLSRSVFVFSLLLLGTSVTRADTILTMTFENVSNRPEYNWIGESFSVLMSDLLDIPGLVTIGPDERNVSFDRLGIPSGTILTKATAIKIDEKSNGDLLLLCTYNVAGDV